MNYTKISIIFKSANKPPYFIGSQIRGALGYALKKVTCINPSFKCDGCFATSSCLYYEFYEEKNTFHKYRLDFELGLDYYNFSLYLFDDSALKLPYIVSALHLMLTKNGLGKDRVTYKEFDMYINDESCMENGNIKLPKEFIKKLQIDKNCQDIELQLVTPLRLKQNGKLIRSENLTLKDLVLSIYQRQLSILGHEYRRFPYEITGEITSKDINFKELTRLSNRQKTTMNMGGLMGKVTMSGLNKESYEVLKVGELLGVGKQTVFGLGKIKLEDIV